MMKKLFKTLSMSPIFLFIGIGIFLSLDIVQPSMFRHMDEHWPIFVAAALVGSAPIYLVTVALAPIVRAWRAGSTGALVSGISLCAVFMVSEVIYSYAAVGGFFYGSEVPAIKVLGVMFLPLTFSLFYFVSIFLEAPIAAEDEPKAYKGPSFDAWGIDVPAELLSNPKVAKEVQDLIDLYGDMYNDLQDAIATHSEGDITA